MTITAWNKMVKPLEVDTEAVEGDIVDYVDGLYCLCQCQRGGVQCCNNIVVFSYEYNVSHIKAMLKFIAKLYRLHNIQYIRVEGAPGRYQVMKAIFGNHMLLQVQNTGRDVYWCKIDEQVMEIIYDRLLHGLPKECTDALQHAIQSVNTDWQKEFGISSSKEINI